MQIPVTVVIPTRNEEKNISKCLSSLNTAFDQVLVVDSFSTDSTRRIASEFNCKIVDFQYQGGSLKKRNWVLESGLVLNDWVLFLDADEQLTGCFIEEIGSVLTKTSHNGFWVTYQNWFLGKELRFGDPMRKLALFKARHGRYEMLPKAIDLNLDMEIHEHPIVDGTTGLIASKILHNDYKGFHHYIAKHNEYSTWEAKRYLLMGQEALNHTGGTLRQRIKYRGLEMAFFPFLYFAYCYFFKLGILDGLNGFTFARMKMRYFSDIRVKILEERKLLMRADGHGFGQKS